MSTARYLLPLRFFIGLSWIRVGLEKLIEQKWHTGEVMASFLQRQITNGDIHFPLYQSIVNDLFIPNVVALSWIMIIGQLLAGVAIVAGAFTNLALLGGLFMNLNFILAGRVNPSALYVVIQTALFIANTGAVFGADAIISRFIPTIFISSQPQYERTTRALDKWIFLFLAVLSWSISLMIIFFIRDYSLHSLGDPDKVLLILAVLGGISSFIIFIRLSKTENFHST